MISILMPKLGLTMTSGTIQRWLKNEGEVVRAGESLLEIETDKSSATVDAPADGTLWEIKFKAEGDEVDVGTVVAYLLEENEIPPAENVPAEASPDAVGATEEDVLQVTAVKAPVSSGDRIKASPAARKLAKDLGISLADVQPNQKGIIHLAQVRAHQAAIAQEHTPTPEMTPMHIPAVEVRTAPLAQIEEVIKPAPAAVESGDTEVMFTGIRKTVARRMTQSVQEVPHFYHLIRIDMTRAKELMACQSVKASVHDMLIRVLARALADYPEINAHVYEDRMILKKEINVGVAVATEKGLVVPVVRNVAHKPLQKIAEESAVLVRRARNGELQPDEYQGGTFTISNLGMFGIEQFTAIINQPEAAILAVGSIVETPVVENGELVIRPMMTVTASFDHRAIDGATGAKFLAHIKQLMEIPELLI